MPLQDPGPLPGGTSVRHARNYITPQHLELFAAVFPFGVAVAAAGLGDFLWAAGFILLGAGATYFAVQPAGLRVTARSQPELWTVVATTAKRVGVPQPRKSWLTDTPAVVVRVRRSRYDLMIGLPLLACLQEHELRSLIAHELAATTFRRPHLVLPLAERWRDVAVARSDDDAAPEDKRTEQELRNVALKVEHVADRAAIDSAGSREAAARAVAIVDGLEMTLYDFRYDLGLPEPSLRRPVQQGLEDVDEVWRRALQDGLQLWVWYDEVAVELAHKHPPLAEAILGLDEADVALSLPTSPVRLRPLDKRSRRRLARGYLGIRPLAAVRWHTVETAPTQWWQARARRSVDRLRSDVAKVLGREPVGHVEMAEVFLLRHDEIAALREPVSAESAEEEDADDETLAPILSFLFEDALMTRGWRLEHPIRRGVLIGPQGQRLDTNTLTSENYLDVLTNSLSIRAAEGHRL